MIGRLLPIVWLFACASQRAPAGESPLAGSRRSAGESPAVESPHTTGAPSRAESPHADGDPPRAESTHATSDPPSAESQHRTAVPHAESKHQTDRPHAESSRASDGPHAESPRAGDPPRIVVREPTVGPHPDLSPELLRRVMRPAMPNLRACHASARAPEPGEAPVLSFVIEPGGSVGAVDLGRSTDDALRACITRVLRGLRFPARQSGGSVRVTYPM